MLLAVLNRGAIHLSMDVYLIQGMALLVVKTKDLLVNTCIEERLARFLRKANYAGEASIRRHIDMAFIA
jgi:hypothetical protein